MIIKKTKKNVPGCINYLIYFNFYKLFILLLQNKIQKGNWSGKRFSFNSYTN